MINEKKYLTPRDIASAQKKEHIFNVALDLFKEYGYQNVTMKTISRESGISEGSIYNFFGEKAGILSMITDQIQKQIYPLIEPTEENLKEPAVTIYKYMVGQCDAYEALGRDIAQIYLSSVGKFTVPTVYGKNFIYSVSKIEPDLVEFLQIVIKEKRMTCSIELEEFAFLLINLGAGMLHSWCTHGEGYTLHDAAEIVFKDLIRKICN